MKWYRVTLDMHSWTASAWHADTIFGHLCWGMRYLHGQDDLRDFLEWYEQGMPPILLSNGFPGDMLPKPLLPPIREDVAGTLLEEQRDQFRRSKDIKKIGYLTPEEFHGVIKGGVLSNMVKPRKDWERFETRRVTLKNQINRLTGTTGGEGRLYPFTEFHWKTVSIYLKIEDSFVETARSLFDYLAAVGYGKRKSVGYGQIKSLRFEGFDGFATPEHANGFVTLSNFVPCEADPAVGNWRHLVKYGKLGEEYSLEEMVFKRPLLMLEAGSTFYDASCREFYGRTVPRVSPVQPQVVQYGFALPVPIRLPDVGAAG